MVPNPQDDPDYQEYTDYLDYQDYQKYLKGQEHSQSGSGQSVKPQSFMDQMTDKASWDKASKDATDAWKNVDAGQLGRAFVNPAGVIPVAKMAGTLWGKTPEVAKTAVKYGLEHMGIPVRAIELGTGLLKGAKGLLGKEAAQEVEQAAGSAASKAPAEAATSASEAIQPKIDPFRVRRNNNDK